MRAKSLGLRTFSVKNYYPHISPTPVGNWARVPWLLRSMLYHTVELLGRLYAINYLWYLQMLFQYLILSFLIICFHQSVEVDGAKILMLTPMGSKSHKNFFWGLAEGLGKKGHEVKIIYFLYYLFYTISSNIFTLI